MRPILSAVYWVLAALLLSGCGGGGGGGGTGGGSGGGSGPDVTIVALFNPTTRAVPGYADTLRVTITPPTNVTLPAGVPSQFNLTRAASTRVLEGLKQSAAPYLLFMEALTDGTVVGTVQRSVFVSSGQDFEVDVSASLNSLVDSVAIDGAPTVELGDNFQLTAHARNAAGATLFSGAGFSWTSTNPFVLFIDPDTGFAVTRDMGTATVRATLKGTTLKADLLITVTGDALITVTPANPTVQVSEDQQFSAQVSGLPSSDVTWSVDEPGGGTITSGGLYTAPAIMGTYHVRATSVDFPAISGATSVTVDGGWQVFELHPPGAFSSTARWVRGGQIVGNVTVEVGEVLFERASLWIGTTNVWIDFTPTWAERCHINATDGVQQVGSGYTGNIYRPLLWSGTAGSWVDLTPAGAEGGGIGGIDSGIQVGQSTFGGLEHACLWSGTAQSWVSLHPAGAERSYAIGIHQGQQVGDAKILGVYHASLWTGTVESWVDITPAGATSSNAYDVYSGVQVGGAKIGGVERAGLWTGTAASWVSLHPTGATRSEAVGVHDGEQVGYATFGNKDFAAIWSGSAGSRINLHSSLPSRFDQSIAYGIWHDGNVTYVVGSAHDLLTNRSEAVLWVRAVN